MYDYDSNNYVLLLESAKLPSDVKRRYSTNVKLTNTVGEKYSREFLVGVYHRVSQILTLFQTHKKCYFSNPFSDLASKILTLHSQTRP